MKILKKKSRKEYEGEVIEKSGKGYEGEVIDGDKCFKY